MIELVKDTIDKKDIKRLIGWLKTYPRLTKGAVTVEFESRWSKMLGVQHSTFVNSGSSAILMMLQALLEARYVDRGAKVVVPALSWATDFSSVLQLGFDPVICDCNLTDLSVDLTDLERLFQEEKPAVLLLVSVLGLVPDMDKIVELCRQYNVILLEDACESLGSEHKGKKLGNFGLMSCFSSYFGHHISTIEGGMVCTNDSHLNMVLKAIRNHGWDRDLTPEQQKKLREDHGIGDFSALYTFYFLGFNFRSTDLQAFIGLGQLEKLPEIIRKRNKNYELYRSSIKLAWRPESAKGSYESNFAYPVLSTHKAQIINDLKDLAQVRPLICGSMTSQPFFFKEFPNHHFKTPNAALVDAEGLYLPNHPLLKRSEIKAIAKVINKYA